VGVISDKDIDSYRKFKSFLEGHPTPRFIWVEAATGSLGQGLSIGVGESLLMKSEVRSQRSEANNSPIVYVLLGDGEVAEGSVWEAIEVASYYKLDNLVGIIDVNRLGQSGETMLGYKVSEYKKRIEAFGWQTYVIDGHNFNEINKVFDKVSASNNKPKMIIAKTIKGKGVSFLENKEGWHGKPLPEEEYKRAIKELGKINKEIKGEIKHPNLRVKSLELRVKKSVQRLKVPYKIGDQVATRMVYGEALAKLGDLNLNIVALDGETKNSTYSEIFKNKHPQRFYEMFIAEQNMVGVAIGMSKRGKVPFASTFAAFWTRAFDQIRMSAISQTNVKFVGSHAGISIGEDGPSQMGLEDFAMFRSIFGSTVLCPADAVATWRIVEIMAKTSGLFYMRTNRPVTPVIYKSDQNFEIGGSKVLKQTKTDKVTVVSCGVTLFEALKAADVLAKKGINVRVVDAYSIKPIDQKTLIRCARDTEGRLIVVEDHYFEGGLGEAVSAVLSDKKNIEIYRLAVGKMPMSGKKDDLYDYEEISAKAIVGKVCDLLK
ncbi:transketolase, partial [Candidatus Curtissbacteria bacterium RBG_13_35_7]